MRKSSLLLFLLFFSLNAFCQFEGGGSFVGWQFSYNKMNAAYYRVPSGQSIDKSSIDVYEDRFWFHGIDFRYGNYQNGGLVELDGSGAMDMMILIVYLIAEKEYWKKKGKLRGIEDNIAAGVKGKAADWSLFNMDLAGGSDYLAMGIRWDLGMLGTDEISNVNNTVYEFRENNVYRTNWYNSLGLGVYGMSDIMVGSFRLDWLRSGKRNGFELYPELKFNMAIFYATIFYRYRRFVEIENDVVGYKPPFATNTIGFRMGLWIADW